MVKLVRVLGVIGVVSLMSAGPAFAQALPSDAPVTHDGAAPADSAEPAMPPEEGPAIPWQPGPKQIDLGHGAKPDLPDTHRFLAQPDAGKLMEKIGNLHNEDLMGLVISNNDEDEYLVTLRYEDSGYIKDDEELDGKELLESIREGE